MARIATAEQETAKYQATLKETQMQNEKIVMELKENTEDFTERVDTKIEISGRNIKRSEKSTMEPDLQIQSKEQEASSLQEKVDTLLSNEKKMKLQIEEVSQREMSQQRENSDLNLRWEQRWEEERSRESTKHAELTAVLQKQRDHLAREKKDLEERVVDLEADLNRTRAELNAVRAHSRLSESLSNQYGKIIDRRSDTNAMNAHHNSDNLPPLNLQFSEDMGPPSPLKFEMGQVLSDKIRKAIRRKCSSRISVMRRSSTGRLGEYGIEPRSTQRQ